MKTEKVLNMWSSPFSTYKRILDQLLLNPLMCFLPYTLHTQTHTHTHMITHISGICRIKTMTVLMFYQTTSFTDCLITLINTPQYAYVDVLPVDTEPCKARLHRLLTCLYAMRYSKTCSNAYCPPFPFWNL
jgi:hypothetical protein